MANDNRSTPDRPQRTPEPTAHKHSMSDLRRPSSSTSTTTPRRPPQLHSLSRGLYTPTLVWAEATNPPDQPHSLEETG